MPHVPNSKGVLRPYLEARELGVIDTRIRLLVDAMNVPGVVATHSSCAGHRWWPMAVYRTPFVMFRTETRLAAELASRIHDDWLADSRALHHYWDVDAQFDNDGELLFTLRSLTRRFNRARMDCDFETLRLWVQEIVQSGDQPERIQPDVYRDHAQHEQDRQHLAKLALKRVRGTACRARCPHVGRQHRPAHAAGFHRHGDSSLVGRNRLNHGRGESEQLICVGGVPA